MFPKIDDIHNYICILFLVTVRFVVQDGDPMSAVLSRTMLVNTCNNNTATVDQ